LMAEVLFISVASALFAVLSASQRCSIVDRVLLL